MRAWVGLTYNHELTKFVWVDLSNSTLPAGQAGDCGELFVDWETVRLDKDYVYLRDNECTDQSHYLCQG